MSPFFRSLGRSATAVEAVALSTALRGYEYRTLLTHLSRKRSPVHGDQEFTRSVARRAQRPLQCRETNPRRAAKDGKGGERRRPASSVRRPSRADARTCGTARGDLQVNR